ncbi:alpha/beta hydrolase [Ectothiorhodospiraceae bacterium WFHF3C12]|nr:alpha/beta hydrolase [Ectothiorhodospiraceae bacterium WFHF3C12]
MGRVFALLAGLILSGAAPAGDVSWLEGTDARATRFHSRVFDTGAAVYEAGPSTGDPVLLVHGLGTDGARFWRELIPALAKRHRVVAVDLPGFGGSGKPNALYSPENYAAFLDELVSERFDSPVALVGHSMGAAVALYYAHAHPDRVERLVMASTAGILHGAAYAHFLSRYGVQRYLPQIPGIGEVAGKLVQRILTKFERLGPDPATALKTPESRELYLEADPARIAGLALVSTDFSRIVRETRVPAYVLWGGDEEVAPLRVGYLLTTLLPNSRLKIVEGGSHVFPLEQADRFNRLVGNALRMPSRGFLDFAQDGYPRKTAERPPGTGRTAECRGEHGRVFTGEFRRLLIYDCEDVIIRDAHIGRLEILSSRATLRNTVVHGDEVALVLAHSTVEMTASRIQAPVAIDATGSRVDAAGVTLKASRIAIRAPAPSVFTFSVSLLELGGERRYLHDVVEVTSKNPL